MRASRVITGIMGSLPSRSPAPIGTALPRAPEPSRALETARDQNKSTQECWSGQGMLTSCADGQCCLRRAERGRDGPAEPRLHRTRDPMRRVELLETGELQPQPFQMTLDLQPGA